MAADFNFLTSQANNGKSIAVSGATTVHTVPNGERHEIVVLANATAAEDITVKIDGESVGIVESLTAKQSRIVWTGVITGGASNSTVICSSSSTTARFWGKYIKLS
jgi:hypothetical protein